ncbi:hypothetical protein Taro_055094 [Colocasia esculenta]|uniref:Uncharacterized protein n=1 Tax=Colocasia esculenta TaxID=4460 RepID=A0A843XRX2_COLES|nr:hypothetical protein [Colocasia esculenta]
MGPQFGIGTSRRSTGRWFRGIPFRSVSLDYANRWRGQHMELTCHDDRKSCSAQHEISSTGRRYGCTNIVDIVTPSRLFSPLQRKNWP